MLLHDGIAWHYLALHGVAWYCLVLFGIAWYRMVLFGIVCSTLPPGQVGLKFELPKTQVGQ